MALSAATLASMLEGLVPVDNEPEAIDNFASAWEGYFKEATVAGIAADETALAPATTALKAALVGISAPGVASTSLAAGITAFWNVVATTGALIWDLSPNPPIAAVTPPPGLTGVKAALDTAFATNLAAEADLPTAAQEVSDKLHPTQTGALAAITPPPPGVTIPIL